MDSSGKEKLWGRFLLSACILVIFAEMASFFTVTYSGRMTAANQDMYCDVLVGRLIWEQKTIFPGNWSFGNQYNVISTPVAMALFYGLTGSMNLSMVLGSMAMNLFIVAAFVWAFSPFCSRLQLSGGIMMLLGCIICKNAAGEIVGYTFYILANYYACYIMVLLVVWGYWVRLLADPERPVLSPAFFLSAVLSFLIGMQSIRQLLAMVLPMAALDVLRLLGLSVRQHGRLEKRQLRPTAACAVIGLANLLGLLFVKSLNLPHTTIYGSGGLNRPGEWLTQFFLGIKNILQLTGLPNIIHNLFGGSPLETAMAFLALCLWLVSVGIVLAALVRACILAVRSDTHSIPPADLFVLLSFISLLGTLAVQVLLRMEMRQVYYFPWLPLVGFSTVSVVGRLKNRFKTLLLSILCVLVLNNMVYSYGTSLTYTESVNEELKETSEWVTDHDYQYVYGYWVTVTRMAPYGNGSYIAASWFDQPFEILDYINVTDAYSEEDNKNAVYLVAKKELPGVEDYLEQINGTMELEYTSSNGTYMLFTSPDQLMHQ